MNRLQHTLHKSNGKLLEIQCGFLELHFRGAQTLARMFQMQMVKLEKQLPTLMSLSRDCGTVAERSPCDQEVMGTNLVECWAFFSFFTLEEVSGGGAKLQLY